MAPAPPARDLVVLQIRADLEGRRPTPRRSLGAGRQSRSTSVEDRLGQDLIPLAERCGRVMREALAALEATREPGGRTIEAGQDLGDVRTASRRGADTQPIRMPRQAEVSVAFIPQWNERRQDTDAPAKPRCRRHSFHSGMKGAMSRWCGSAQRPGRNST